LVEEENRHHNARRVASRPAHYAQYEADRACEENRNRVSADFGYGKGKGTDRQEDGYAPGRGFEYGLQAFSLRIA